MHKHSTKANIVHINVQLESNNKNTQKKKTKQMEENISKNKIYFEYSKSNKRKEKKKSYNRIIDNYTYKYQHNQFNITNTTISYHIHKNIPFKIITQSQHKQKK